MAEAETSRREELERLILQKRRLQNEIDIMEKQKEEYGKNKEFYDKLILFHQKIQDLRIVKEDMIARNQELNKTNERIKMKIREVEDAISSKDEQEKLLNELLDEVKYIKNCK